MTMALVIIQCIVNNAARSHTWIVHENLNDFIVMDNLSNVDTHEINIIKRMTYESVLHNLLRTINVKKIHVYTHVHKTCECYILYIYHALQQFTLH